MSEKKREGKAMAIFMCDFELVDYDGDDIFVVYPVGLGGATEGHGFDDAVRMAADWLRETALDFLMREEKWPDLPLGTNATRGGRMVTLAIETSLDQVPAVTAAEAARRLGVSSARVSQLCKAGDLESWKVGGTRMVSVESIEMRCEDEDRVGHHHKEPVMA
jgi:excisionase family DNA binding protein